MDIAALALMIPITAIVLGVGGGIVQSILKSQERRLELRLRAQQGKNEEVTQQLETMRAEIASLRDTSTQFDMSLEHTVQRLEEKVARLESKGQIPIVPASPAEETQHVGLH